MFYFVQQEEIFLILCQLHKNAFDIFHLLLKRSSDKIVNHEHSLKLKKKKPKKKLQWKLFLLIQDFETKF